jgi:hypothetical protein
MGTNGPVLSSVVGYSGVPGVGVVMGVGDGETNEHRSELSTK